MSSYHDVQALIRAIDGGDVAAAQQLLSDSPHLALSCNEEAWTPLMSACRLRDVGLVQALLALGAPVNVRNRLDPQSGEGDNFALWFAANRKQPNRVEVARLLVEHGAQVNMVGEFGETPLHQAAAWNNGDIAEYLLSVGAAVNAEILPGKTPLRLALQYGFNAVAEGLGRYGAKDSEIPLRVGEPEAEADEILTQRTVKPVTHIPNTQTIFLPIDTGDLEAVQQLLEADAGLAHVRRITHDDTGILQRGIMSETALIAAAKAGHLEIVKLLIEYGAEIYEPTQWGYPAVEHAFWAKQQHIVDFFLGEAAKHESMRGAPTFGLGIDVNLATRNGWLPFVEQHLKQDPLAVHRRGVIGETPLHWAAHNGLLKIVHRLLEAGADGEADEIGCYGGKPLHWAAEHSPVIVQLLLERGADVNSRNLMAGELEGVTPLIMCARQKDDCAECAELLLGAGADLDAQDAAGKTALNYAEEHGHTRVTGVLRRAFARK